MSVGGFGSQHSFKTFAMLYKNDEQVKLTPAQIKEIKSKFRKFPIRAIYPEERVNESPSAHNTLPDKPNSLSFPLKASVKSETGIDVWRYAENVVYGTDGQKKFIPINLRYTGSIALTYKDMELIWFLWKFCPYTKEGENWNKKVPKIEFENLVERADAKAQKEEQKADFKALIYSTKVGLKEDQLRKVAKALMIPGVDELTPNQVRLHIEQRVLVDRQNGIANFLNMVDSESVLNIRASIQTAVDEGIIKFIANTKEWVWTDDKGKRSETICKVTSRTNRDDAIFNTYAGDESFKERLDSALKIPTFEE